MGFLPRLEIVQVAKQGKPAGISRDVFSSHTAVPGGCTGTREESCRPTQAWRISP